MSNLFVLTKKEVFEQVRSYKLLIIVFVLLFFALSSVIIAKITPELLKNYSVQGITISMPAPTYLDSLDQFMKNNGQLVIFILLFVVAGAVSEEKVRKTLEILLAKPVQRTTFVLSKFFSYFLTITAVFSLASVVFYYYTVTIFSTFSALNFFLVCLLTLAFILSVVSVTIMGSTVFKNNLAAAGLGFFYFVTTMVLGSMLPRFSKYFPAYIFSEYKKLILNGWSTDYFYSLVVAVVAIISAIMFSIFYFSNAEIDR